MSSVAIRQLRLLGMVEAVSFLVLLGIAMPLKYLAGQPAAVSVVGMVHGMLFLVYVIAIGYATMSMRWPRRRAALLVAAAFVPLGPFLMDHWLRGEQRAAAEREAVAAAG